MDVYKLSEQAFKNGYEKGVSDTKSEVEELKAIIADHKANEERLEELYSNAKTEIERLTINMNAYGLTAKRLAAENESLEIELENMRRNLGDARDGWNDAECEAERLRKAIDEYEETSGLKQAKQEVAREIFAGIDSICIKYFDRYGRYIMYREDFDELKKKYTEDKT